MTSPTSYMGGVQLPLLAHSTIQRAAISFFGTASGATNGLLDPKDGPATEVVPPANKGAATNEQPAADEQPVANEQPTADEQPVTTPMDVDTSPMDVDTPPRSPAGNTARSPPPVLPPSPSALCTSCPQSTRRCWSFST
jgi:hypothetical protein